MYFITQLIVFEVTICTFIYKQAYSNLLFEVFFLIYVFFSTLNFLSL